jgi:hypothetical protein
MLRRFIALISLCLLSALTAQAQFTGVIKGQVTDQSGARLPGAALTLAGAQLHGQKTAVADAEGNFIFLGLAPGSYEIEVKQNGFQPGKQENIQLRAGQTLTLDLRLAVGGVNQAVNIAARGGGESIPIIDTTNPEINFNVSGEFLNKLPMSSRQNWESVWGTIATAQSAVFEPASGQGIQRNADF